MACGSCGGGRASGGGPRGRRTLYVLTLPDGTTKTYATQAEAKRVQTRLGGVITTKPGR